MRTSPSATQKARISAEAEAEVCEIIRSNIRDDSRLIRNMELRISRQQGIIRRAEAKASAAQFAFAAIQNAARAVPDITGPDIDTRARGRLGRLARLLRRLGQVVDAVDLGSRVKRELEIEAARRRANGIIREARGQIMEAKVVIETSQTTLDERVVWISRHFDAFDQHDCRGRAFNSFVHSPSAEVRRKLR